MSNEERMKRFSQRRKDAEGRRKKREKREIV